MDKRLYQRNAGQADHWIVEGNVDSDCLQELSTKKRSRCLEFRAVHSFPENAFRELAQLRSLKYLRFYKCSLTPACLGDISALPKLESLWIEKSNIGDDAVERLAGHPTLSQVVLNATAISDLAVRYLVTLPKLEWLWLDETAITDKGIALLVSASRLNSLALRKTSVTDEGILQLASLDKLSLSAGTVRDTAVTEEGLDALFAAQKTERKAIRTPKKVDVAVDPAEVEAARQVLYSFFKAMNEWHIACDQKYSEARKLAEDGIVGHEVWESWRDACKKIFATYCTPRKRAYGRPGNISIGGSPQYESNPESESITSIEAPTRRRMLIDTKQGFGVKYRCQYVLLKKGDRWLIDNKKIWGKGWENTIL